jgi:hypothetical protein
MDENKPIDQKSLEQSLKNLLATKSTYSELLAATKMYNKALGMSADTIADMERGLSSQISLSDRLATQANYVVNRGEKSLQLKRLSTSIDEGALDIIQERAQAEADMLLKQTMYKTGLTGVYAEQAKSLVLAQKMGFLSEEDLNTKLSILATEQKKVNHIKEEVELTEQIADHIKEIKEESMAWKHGFDKILATSKAIATDPKALGAFFLTQVGEKIEHVNHAMHELVDTGMSAGEAINLMREDFSLMSAMGLSKVADVSKDLVANFGTAKVLTEAQRAAVGEMATSFGLAGEEAAGLTMALSRMPGESKDSAINFSETAKSIGKMKGVIPSQLMKEMAKNTGVMATFSKGGAVGFASAAASAKKMGVELSSVASSAEKLLEFESSVNAQMEASVLIGKELNFSKMQEAALAGDLNAVMEEQAKIMGQVGSLDQMNVLQKKALADAMGVTTEELVKMSEAQKFSNQYFGENSTAMDNAVGGLLKYGGAAVGFIANNGMMLITGAQTIIQLMTLNALRAQSTGLTNLGIVSLIKQTGTTIANTAATAANTVARWLGIGAKGAETAANTGLAASNTAVAATSGPAAAGLGVTASAAAIAIIPLLGLAAAAIGFGFALKLAAPTIVGVATVIGNVLIKALEMLPGIITSVADGFTKMFSAVSENIGTLLLLGPALMMIGTGLAFMGTAGLVALPVINALTALGVVGAALGSLGVIGGEGGAGNKDTDDKINKLVNAIDQFVQKTVPIVIKLDGNVLARGTFQGIDNSRIDKPKP